MFFVDYNFYYNYMSGRKAYINWIEKKKENVTKQIYF